MVENNIYSKAVMPKIKQVLPALKENKFLIVSHPELHDVAMHTHAFFELTYIIKGPVEHTIDGQSSILNTGDYFLVDSGSIHSYRTAGGSTFSNLDCMFLPELLDPVLKGAQNLQIIFEHYLLHFNMKALTQTPAGLIFHDENKQIRTLIKKIQNESETHPPGFTEMVRCYLIEILLHTLRRIDNASLAFETHSIASFLTAYIAEHYTERISLSNLAKQLNYSLPYVSKCFHEKTGTAFVAYLQNYRIKQAERLLASTEKTLPEIAEAVGYHDVKFFSGLFKSITEMAPSEFRKMYRA